MMGVSLSRHVAADGRIAQIPVIRDGVTNGQSRPCADVARRWRNGSQRNKWKFCDLTDLTLEYH